MFVSHKDRREEANQEKARYSGAPTYLPLNSPPAEEITDDVSPKLAMYSYA